MLDPETHQNRLLLDDTEAQKDLIETVLPHFIKQIVRGLLAYEIAHPYDTSSTFPVDLLNKLNSSFIEPIRTILSMEFPGLDMSLTTEYVNRLDGFIITQGYEHHHNQVAFNNLVREDTLQHKQQIEKRNGRDEYFRRLRIQTGFTAPKSEPNKSPETEGSTPPATTASSITIPDPYAIAHQRTQEKLMADINNTLTTMPEDYKIIGKWIEGAEQYIATLTEWAADTDQNPEHYKADSLKQRNKLVNGFSQFNSILPDFHSKLIAVQEHLNKYRTNMNDPRYPDLTEEGEEKIPYIDRIQKDIDQYKSWYTEWFKFLKSFDTAVKEKKELLLAKYPEIFKKRSDQPTPSKQSQQFASMLQNIADFTVADYNSRIEPVAFTTAKTPDPSGKQPSI